jgi:hypothetical protein
MTSLTKMPALVANHTVENTNNVEFLKRLETELTFEPAIGEIVLV